MIYTLLYSLAGPRRSNFGTGDRACDCYLVASSFELVSVECERVPANEAILHSCAFLAIGSCGCRESSSKVDMICTLIYSFAEPRRSNFRAGDRVYVCYLFASSLEPVSVVYVRLHCTRLHSLPLAGCREFSWRLDMIYTVLHPLAEPRRSNFGTGDLVCGSLVASSLELFSVVYVTSPENEAIPRHWQQWI